MRRDISSWIATAVLLVAAATGCSADRTRSDTSHASVTTVKPRAAEVRLYEERESASAEGPNGMSIDATLAGKNYPSSTGMWVGCSGTAATATYRLGRNFSRLTATAGLQDHAPGGLAVRVTISGDGRVLSEFTVSKTTTTPVDVRVGNIDSLVVAAIVEEGTCGAGVVPYGALGDAVLTGNLD